MNVDLLVYKDGQPLKTVSVALPVIIGRGKDATFTIKHPLLSRKHCEVFEDSGSVQVRDLASLNGTFVNGSRVDSTSAVDSGSQLKLGAVVMEVQYNGASPEDTIASDHAPEGEAFDLGTVETADTEVMAATPDATEPTPDATEPAPDATEPAPDATEPAPDATEPAPDATAAAPDATEPAPDATAAAPDATEPAPDATAATSDDIPAPSEAAGNMVDLGDFEVLTEAAVDTASSEPAEILDLPDFEESSPDTPPSEEMLDLGDFEVSATAVEEGPAAQDLPSLTDLAGAVDEEPAETAVDTPVPAAQPVAADDPWAAPSEQPKVTVDDDDDLDAFLKDLG